MKKPILFLSFVMLTTMLFAQTLHPISGSNAVRKASTAVKNQPQRSHTNFTKSAITLKHVDFSADNVGYSTGIITEGPEAHGQTADYATWRRIPNADSSTFLAASNIYSALAHSYFGGVETFCSYMMRYADTATSSAENGFMMMSLFDQRIQNTGNFNAYIQIDSIDASDAAVIDVEFFQYYRPFLDHCYIDYSTDGTNWVSTPINVIGIDVSVSNILWGMYVYTLPLAAAGNSNLSIRIRYASTNSNRGAYGYFWMVDDVTIYTGEPNQLKKYAQEYVEGGYGFIPQGFAIQPAWYTRILNNGSANQDNVTARLFHLDASLDNAAEIQSYNNGSISRTQHKDIIVDPAGWICPDSMDARGWYAYAHRASSGTGTSLPSDVVGDNYVYATVSNDNITLSYDTMLYQVSTADSNDYYRWAYDNGVLTYSPYNQWLYGFVHEGGNWYATDDPEEVNFMKPGYLVTNRSPPPTSSLTTGGYKASRLSPLLLKDTTTSVPK